AGSAVVDSGSRKPSGAVRTDSTTASRPKYRRLPRGRRCSTPIGFSLSLVAIGAPSAKLQPDFDLAAALSAATDLYRRAETPYQIPISSLYPGGIPEFAAVMVILVGTKLVPRYSGTTATSLIPPRTALSSPAIELFLTSQACAGIYTTLSGRSC